MTVQFLAWFGPIFQAYGLFLGLGFVCFVLLFLSLRRVKQLKTLSLDRQQTACLLDLSQLEEKIQTIQAKIHEFREIAQIYQGDTAKRMSEILKRLHQSDLGCSSYLAQIERIKLQIPNLSQPAALSTEHQKIESLSQRISELSLQFHEISETMAELKALETEIEQQLSHHEQYLMALIQELKNNSEKPSEFLQSVWAGCQKSRQSYLKEADPIQSFHQLEALAAKIYQLKDKPELALAALGQAETPAPQIQAASKESAISVAPAPPSPSSGLEIDPRPSLEEKITREEIAPIATPQNRETLKTSENETPKISISSAPVQESSAEIEAPTLPLLELEDTLPLTSAVELDSTQPIEPVPPLPPTPEPLLIPVKQRAILEPSPPEPSVDSERPAIQTEIQTIFEQLSALRVQEIQSLRSRSSYLMQWFHPQVITEIEPLFNQVRDIFNQSIDNLQKSCTMYLNQPENDDQTRMLLERIWVKIKEVEILALKVARIYDNLVNAHQSAKKEWNFLVEHYHLMQKSLDKKNEKRLFHRKLRIEMQELEYMLKQKHRFDPKTFAGKKQSIERLIHEYTSDNQNRYEDQTMVGR